MLDLGRKGSLYTMHPLGNQNLHTRSNSLYERARPMEESVKQRRCPPFTRLQGLMASYKDSTWLRFKPINFED